jgi:hypothetical protein
VEANVKKSVSLVLCILFMLEAVSWAGLGGHDAMYVGGTISAVKEKTEGRIATDDKTLIFQYKSGKLTIPYEQVNSLEYGQKAGRRLGLAVAVSPLFLLSKKRRHYLTIGFLDENKKQQAAVLELGKEMIKPTISTLEAKTGKKVEYEDDEARQSAGAGK